MRNILIVEDEPDIQELLCAYLQEAGYGTAVAGDGVAALDLFQSRAFDLVLLDLMLPSIFGSIRSSSTRSKARLWNRSRAATPSPATAVP